jgi:predicted PurR-regulated permease PerM
VIQRPLHTRPQADHEHVNRISTGTILFIITAAALTLYELHLILIPFVFAAVISYILAPAITFASTRARVPRSVVAILAFVGLLAFGGGIGLLGVPALTSEVKHLVTDFQGTIEHFANTLVGNRTISMLGRSMNAHQLADSINNAIRGWIVNARVLSMIAGALFVGGFGFLLTLVLLFFFMLGGPVIVRGLLWLVPPGQRPLIEDHILSKLDPVLRRYFIGVIAVVCFASVFAYVGLGLILGLPNAIFLALITGLLEAVPIVGPAVAAVIAGLIAIQHNSGIREIVGYGIYLTALRLSIDQLFGPLVLGAAGRVHPVLIIFCFLAGGALFGIIGVLLAVPMALVIKTTLAVLYDEPPPGGRPKT